jgi:hypothetical protein
MQPSGPETPIVLVKWYDYAKWLLERVENFPKSQRFVLGQRLANQAMEVMDLLGQQGPNCRHPLLSPTGR